MLVTRGATRIERPSVARTAGARIARRLRMSADPSALSRFLPSRRFLLRLAMAAGMVVALIAIAWIAVPPIVRGQLESRLTEA